MPFTKAEKDAIKLMRGKGLADVAAKYGDDAVIESVNITEDADGEVHVVAHVNASVPSASGQIIRYREDIEL